MSEIAKNLEPIVFDDYARREMTRMTRVGTHASLYVIPDGKIIDCRYPEWLGHDKITAMIYDNLAALSDVKDRLDRPVYCSAISEYMSDNESVSIEDVQELLMEKAGITDLTSQFSKDIMRKYLNDEDLPVHDMGFVKVVITSDGNMKVEVPNNIFNGKTIKAAQEETVEGLIAFHKINGFFLPTALTNAKVDHMRDRNEISDRFPTKA